MKKKKAAAAKAFIERVLGSTEQQKKDREVVNAVIRYTAFPTDKRRGKAIMIEIQLTRGDLRLIQTADAQSQLFLNYVTEMKY